MLNLIRTRGYIISTLKPIAESHNTVFNTVQRRNIDSSNNSDSNNKPKEEPTAVTSRFEVFRDEDATVIFDIEEERERLKTGVVIEETTPDPFEGLNLQRGKSGVYEIEDLVQVLKRDNAQDIFVCRVPKKLKYVDYIVVTHGRSFKHMEAMAEFVRKMYKMKKGKSDVFPKIEGAGSEDWMAMDLGNIALHIFSKTTRTRFDLESLWSVGAAYDSETNKKSEDDVLDLFERHSVFLKDLSSFKKQGDNKELNEDEVSTPFDIPIESETKLT